MPKKFGVKLEKAKKFFFDGKRVESAVDKATRMSLHRIGQFIMSDAKKSMRRKKTKPAPATPATKTPGRRNLKFILYHYEPRSRSVIVGPVRFSTRTNVAKLMEHGGTSRRVHRSRKTGRVTRRTVARYRARPFMFPSLEKNAPKIPNVFKDSLERVARRQGRR